jgi:hypothetical protein
MLLREPDRAERVPVQLEGELFLDGQAYRAHVIDLSLTGAFIEGSHLPVGLRFELHLPLPGGEPMVLRGRVARQGTCVKHIGSAGLDVLALRVAGVGLAFDDLEDLDALRLQDFLDLVHEH